MTDHIIFDNFLVTDSKEVHSSWMAQTWERKNAAEHASSSGVSIISFVNELNPSASRVKMNENTSAIFTKGDNFLTLFCFPG